MSEYLHSNLPVHLRHIPETAQEVVDEHTRREVQLPGMVEIGVEINGVFVPILRRKAAGLLADLQAAEETPPSSTPSIA